MFFILVGLQFLLIWVLTVFSALGFLHFSIWHILCRLFPEMQIGYVHSNVFKLTRCFSIHRPTSLSDGFVLLTRAADVSWMVSALGQGPTPSLLVTATLTAQCLPTGGRSSLDRRIQSNCHPECQLPGGSGEGSTVCG